MSDDPFRYTDTRVTVNGVDIEATDVKVSAIFDDSPSGMRRRLDRQILGVSYKPHGILTTAVTSPTRPPDPKRLYRDMKAMHAKIMDIDPVRVPSAQEIVMRQELGEFDA